MTTVVDLTASTFHGGPERQMLTGSSSQGRNRIAMAKPSRTGIQAVMHGDASGDEHLT